MTCVCPLLGRFTQGLACPPQHEGESATPICRGGVLQEDGERYQPRVEMTSTPARKFCFRSKNKPQQCIGIPVNVPTSLIRSHKTPSEALELRTRLEPSPLRGKRRAQGGRRPPKMTRTSGPVLLTLNSRAAAVEMGFCSGTSFADVRRLWKRITGPQAHLYPSTPTTLARCLLCTLPRI